MNGNWIHILRIGERTQRSFPGKTRPEEEEKLKFFEGPTGEKQLDLSKENLKKSWLFICAPRDTLSVSLLPLAGTFPFQKQTYFCGKSLLVFTHEFFAARLFLVFDFSEQKWFLAFTLFSPFFSHRFISRKAERNRERERRRRKNMRKRSVRHFFSYLDRGTTRRAEKENGNIFRKSEHTCQALDTRVYTVCVCVSASACKL